MTTIADQAKPHIRFVISTQAIRDAEKMYGDGYFMALILIAARNAVRRRRVQSFPVLVMDSDGIVHVDVPNFSSWRGQSPAFVKVGSIPTRLPRFGEKGGRFDSGNLCGSGEPKGTAGPAG